MTTQTFGSRSLRSLNIKRSSLMAQLFRILTLTLFLGACNNLAVFVPSNNRSPAVLDQVALTDEGLLQLSWSSAKVSDQYSIYLLELGEDRSVYNFSERAQYFAPLTYETLKVKGKDSPQKLGRKLDSVADLNYVIGELLEVGKSYAIQISDRQRLNAEESFNVLFVQIDFTKVEGGSAKMSDDNVQVTWNRVPGANRYEVYSDAEMTIKIGESKTNELLVKIEQGRTFKDFYIKAYRGMLQDPNTVRVSLSTSPIKVSRVSSVSPNGFYKAGDEIELKAEFTGPVTVFMPASLPLRFGQRVVEAVYLSGSGTDTLQFTYTVKPGDDTDRISSENSLRGDYVDSQGLNVSSLLPAAVDPQSLRNTSLLSLDTITPTSPVSVGYPSSYSTDGDISITWIASSDLYFLQHRLKICGNISCDANCGSEAAIIGTTHALSNLPEGDYYACVRGEDKAGNMSAWSSSLSPVRVDNTAPAVARVYSNSAPGTYPVGSTLSLAVEFSEAVTVSGDLRLGLVNGGAPAQAQYLSGSGSDTLLFSYTVQTGDQIADLDYIATSSLGWATAGQLRDLAGNPADMDLPAPGSANSLAGQAALVLDGEAPTVQNVASLSPNTSYSAGQTISIAVNFTEAVVLTDPANLRLKVETSNGDRYASYASGSGSTAILFDFEIESGDVSSDLDYSSTAALAFLGSGTLRDAAGNNASLALPAPAAASSLSHQSQIVIDALAPNVSRVFATTIDGVYGESAEILISVEFSEIVNVVDSANLKLQLATGSVNRYAEFQGGSGSTTLEFKYTVVLGDVAGDLNYLSTSALAFQGSGSVRDALQNDADLDLPAIGHGNSLGVQSSISIDTSGLEVSYVAASTVPGTYKAGDTILIDVVFSKNVDVTDGGNLKLTLDTGAGTRLANYVGGTGTDTLEFSYVVQAGDLSSDLNYDSNTALSFHNGSTGTVEDNVGLVATLFLPATGSADSLAGRSAIVIDSRAPTVARVYAVSADGAYKDGDILQIAVEFDEDFVKTGAGALTLALASDALPQDADFDSLLGARTLLFNYTVLAGDETADLNYSATNALVKGGTISIKDAVGNEADLTLPPLVDTESLAGQSAIVIDNTAPVVERVLAQTGNGTYKAGDLLEFLVEFSEAVVLSPAATATLDLNMGATRQAVLSSHNGDTLEFSYTVQAADTASDLNYVNTTALALGALVTLEDAAGNTGVLTLPGLGDNESLAGQSAIVVDTTSPSVVRVYSQTVDGSYDAGDVIQLVVEFDEDVVLSDAANLRLSLETGTTDHSASYLSGSGSNEIILSYTVQSGDNTADLNYLATNSLAFSGSGAIADAVGNTANYALPALAEAESLAEQSDIHLDALAPLAPLFTAPNDNATLTTPITAISGTSEANATVEVFQDGVSLGTTSASGAGVWSLSLTPSILNGTYILAAEASDAIGNTGPQGSISVIVAIPLPTADAGADIYAGVSSTAFGSTTNAVSRSWTKVSGPGTVSASAPTADTSDFSMSTEGVYVLRLSATNANGDTVTDEMTFTWDTTPPTFTGITDITMLGSNTTRIFWSAASDALTDHKDITYEICLNSTLGSCAASFVANNTSTGWDHTYIGLGGTVPHEFMVRAKDRAGNYSDGNGAMVSGGLRDYVSFAAGEQFSCVAMADGTVKCWGGGAGGQLGQGDFDHRYVPTTVPGISGAVKVAAGWRHACAILSNATVKCWGSNVHGALGDGTTDDPPAPVTVSGLSNVVDISLGTQNSCALISGGTVKCWGRGDYGQLGNSDTEHSSTPVPVTGITNASSLSSGLFHQCAALANKTLKCWGRNQNGQVGTGDTTNVSTPHALALTDVEQVDAAYTYSCARFTNGTVSCWGDYNYGTMGVFPVAANVLTPTAIPGLTNVVKIASGYTASCAILNDQSLKCWGLNNWGQLGKGDFVDSWATPVAVPNIGAVADVYMNNDTTCARLVNGSTRCWGRDDFGQIGDGSHMSRASPAGVYLILQADKVESGIDHSCVLKQDKTVQCWGSNWSGNLGIGWSMGFQGYGRSDPQDVGLTDVDQISVGAYHTCALLSDQTVRCWGENSNGELGDGTTTDSNVPRVVVAPGGGGGGVLGGVSSISAGRLATCATLSAGGMVCWGNSGAEGLLGNGATATVSSIPVVATHFLGSIKQVAFGYNHLCVLKNDLDKSVECLGANNFYQLGNGTDVMSTSPVATLTGAEDIRSFREHSCAIMSDTTMKCWGYNSTGAVGLGNFFTYGTPQTVVGLSDVVGMDVGSLFTCAILSDGSTKCWGEDNDDRLGDTTIVGDVNQSLPVNVTGLSGATSIGLGFAHACVSLHVGTVKCWGYNNINQAGVHNNYYYTPFPRSALSR